MSGGRKPKSGAIGGRPAAAMATTDAESGTDEDSLARSIRALDVMRERGLIDPETYDARRAALERDFAEAKPEAGG